ncbi:MAG: GNAT family N-acetyltransferase [Altibacter sp.]|uniref:GNAT family N-acetyltransferase n=1 Tax=Altibacter sp. TaxID=2024823 RepID=UPI001E087FF5|nr:GNAT family N-acetyltransferase [Altibacter sp.]MBZ0326439.1 GNAT family N-acetyltransferase [Altibacter sp.]
MREYIITTQRLGLRNWLPSDEAPFIEMCQDEAVMKHFPKVLSKEETLGLIGRLKAHFEEHGYCYFAVDLLETSEFIGFTGLANQIWESAFTPCVDIGWRLKRAAWGKGYATEAAAACLNAAFTTFNLNEVLAFATNTNSASEQVMKKLGMNYIGNVQHPLIENDDRFTHCVVYKVLRN